jgi:hypothetical protein
MAKGAQFFHRNYFSLFVSMLTGLLSLMYVETIVRVLHLTGRSHAPVLAFTRYLGTLNHAVQWYEGLASLQASLRTVLQLHRAAALRTRRSEDDPSISQFDMVVTQWAFIGKFKKKSLMLSVPDPDWIRIQSSQWIRIQESKNDPQK